MNMTHGADLEMESQESIHRMNREQVANMVNLAQQFSSILDHDAITVADVRYAACAVMATGRVHCLNGGESASASAPRETRARPTS